MKILNNSESAWDEEFSFDSPNLATKIFSDLVCSECESKPIPVTDDMGREKFWEDLGRP
jgi:hypothetical protein